jgi:hypothetical protein
MNMAAFKNDPAKYARYVEGKTASVIRGKAVTPNYKRRSAPMRRDPALLSEAEAFRWWTVTSIPPASSRSGTRSASW